MLGPDAIVDGAELAGANLAGADLRYIKLYSSDLTGADLSGANLEESFLVDTSLLNADVSGANLSDVDWLATVCPDGQLSSSVGDTCCGHHVGGAPASCGP